MVKHIIQKKDLIGLENKYYLYKGNIIYKFPTFLYCITVYKYWKFGSCELGKRYFTSDKLLDLKCFNQLSYYCNYTIEKDISLCGAPQEFIEDNKLPTYESNVKLKCRKQKK